jgi:hypothetical protein
MAISAKPEFCILGRFFIPKVAPDIFWLLFTSFMPDPCAQNRFERLGSLILTLRSFLLVKLKSQAYAAFGAIRSFEPKRPASYPIREV